VGRRRKKIAMMLTWLMTGSTLADVPEKSSAAVESKETERETEPGMLGDGNRKGAKRGVEREFGEGDYKSAGSGRDGIRLQKE
jgi:hypothetical protein